MTRLIRYLIPAAFASTLLPAWGADLPEGKGKEIVAGMCNTCHTEKSFS